MPPQMPRLQPERFPEEDPLVKRSGTASPTKNMMEFLKRKAHLLATLGSGTAPGMALRRASEAQDLPKHQDLVADGDHTQAEGVVRLGLNHRSAHRRS